MAKILDPKLAIDVNLPGGNVKATVTCRVKFTEYELDTMQHHIKYRLDCELKGADWPDGDDSINVIFKRIKFPETSPTIGTVSFTETFSSSKLDEDYLEDEIYARLTLTNLETRQKITKTSNEISHFF